VSESDFSRKHALECLRLSADCMQLVGDVRSLILQRHFLKWPRPGQGRPKTAPARTAPTLLYEVYPPKTNIVNASQVPAIPPRFCIALNGSRGRRQEGIEPLPYDGVAFAGCLFEAGAIENLHLTSTIAD
jgi:hypothetical protein